MPNTRSLASDHRRHDWLLIARFAAGDAEFGQDHEARDLVRRCSECAALAADIRRISNAVGQLPAAARPRDFRLTAEQADRLRGSRLERWLRVLTGSGWATVRPVAAMALSVGLVMSVVGFLPSVGAGAPGATLETDATYRNIAPGPTFDAANSDVSSPAPVVGQTPPGTTGITAPGLSTVGADSSPQPPLEEFNNIYVQPSPGAVPAPGQATGREKATEQALPGPRDLLIYAGLGTAALALVVLVLIYAARQRFRDPLLR